MFGIVIADGLLALYELEELSYFCRLARVIAGLEELSNFSTLIYVTRR